MTTSHSAEIRKTLNNAFDDVSLSAFCQDYIPEVSDKFGYGMRKDVKITLLLQHCDQRSTGFEMLRDFVRQEYESSNSQREELKPLLSALEAYLNNLTSAQSSLVQEVLDYLDTLASRTAELPKYYPSHLRTSEMGKTRFDDIRQMVQVVEDRSIFEKWRAEEQERARAAGMDVDHYAYAPKRARPETEEDDVLHGESILRLDFDRLAYAPNRTRPESEADNKQKPPEPKPPVPWDEEAGKRFKRAVILADPGFGKTWLLRYEARRLAREEAEHLRQGSKSLSEIILPIFERLSDVNRCDTSVQKSLVVLKNLVALIGEGHSEAFRSFALKKIKSERCAILLDAWDEVLDNRQRLGEWLFAFARHFPEPRLLMTSRIVGYTECPIPDAQELELIAFDTPQVSDFAHIWFKDNKLADQFMAMLDQNVAVRGLTRIPLMLTLACRAYQENQLTSPRLRGAPTRRVDLYESCLRGLLRDWKEEKQKYEWEITDDELDAQLDLLQVVSYALFTEGYQQFSASLLRKKIIASLKKLDPWHDLYATKPTTFIKNLKQDGILISAGADRHAPLLFLHRTFHEYLAARALAVRANEEGWHTIAELMDQKAWLSSWQEVIILLTGQLDDPTFLLELLADEGGDDYFRHRLALATRCLPEIPASIRHQLTSIIDQIATDIFNLCWQYESHDTLYEMAHLMRALPALTQGGGRVALSSVGSKMPLSDALISLLHDENKKIRLTAAGLIGKLGSGIVTLPIFASLANLCRGSSAPALLQGPVPADLWLLSSGVCNSVPKAVGLLREAAATPAFLERLADLLRERDQAVRQCAVIGVKHLGKAVATPAFLERLVDLLCNPSSEVRESAAEVVGLLGEAAATPAILSSLADLLRDPNKWVRQRAIFATQNLGETVATPAILSSLTDLLRDSDEEETLYATKVVLQLGVAAANSAFLEVFADWFRAPDGLMRLKVVEEFGEAVTETYFSGLADLLRDPDVWGGGTARAVEELGEAAIETYFSDFADLFRDEDDRVRASAARAVEELGEAVFITPAILSGLADLLRDPDREVRESVAGAVGKLGEAAATETILEHLADLLCDSDKGVRNSATQVVRELGEAAATPLILAGLADLLRDQDKWVRKSAARAVGKLGEAAATPLILQRLADLLRDENDGVRSSAAEAVGKLREAAATEPILERLAALLRDNNWEVRQSAFTALKLLGEAAATPTFLERLADLLRDENDGVRSSAAEAVGELGEAAATPAILERLAALLGEPDERLRLCAARAVAQLGEAAATPAILERLAALLRNSDTDVCQSAASAVGKLGEAAATETILERLVDLLRDPDERFRSDAVETLGLLGKAAATPAILSHLADLLRDQNDKVRKSAFEAMCNMMRSGVRIFNTSQGFEAKMVRELAGE